MANSTTLRSPSYLCGFSVGRGRAYLEAKAFVSDPVSGCRCRALHHELGTNTSLDPEPCIGPGFDQISLDPTHRLPISQPCEICALKHDHSRAASMVYVHSTSALGKDLGDHTGGSPSCPEPEQLLLCVSRGSGQGLLRLFTLHDPSAGRPSFSWSQASRSYMSKSRYTPWQRFVSRLHRTQHCGNIRPGPACSCGLG